MMKTSKNLILLGLVVCFFLAGQAFSEDRYVVGGSGGPYHYATIQEAVDDALPTETIYILDSENEYLGIFGTDVYSEEIDVGVNDIAFVGVGDVTISQPTKTPGVGFDISGTDGVSFSNLTINGFTTAGIMATAATNVTISGVTFTGNDFGVLMGGASTFDINTCSFTGSGSAGVSLSGNGPVNGNTFSANNVGIDIAGGTAVDVFDNVVTGNTGAGIWVSLDVDGNIYDNNVNANGVGIDVTVAQGGGYLYIYNNCIANNTVEAQDVNSYPPTNTIYWFKSGVGNYYRDYSGTGSYAIGSNWDHFPLTGSNNPSTAKTNVALGEAFTIDFTYTSPGLCDPFPNLKTCHFEVRWDDPDLFVFDNATAGSYLPSVSMVTNPGVEVGYGYCEFDMSALGDGNFATDFSGLLASLHMIAASDAIGTATFTIEATSPEYVDKDGVPIAISSTSLAVTVEDVIPPTIVSAVLVESPTDDGSYGGDYPLKLDYELEDDFDLFRFARKVYDESGTMVWNWVNILPHPDGPGPVTGQYVMDVSTLADGNYYLALRLRDDAPAYNEDLWDYVKSSALAFSVDNTPPAAPTFTMQDPDGCADAGWFGPGDVIQCLSSETEYEMEFSFGFGGRGAVPYDGDYALDVTTSPAYPYADDGTVNVWMRLIDIFGNVGGWTGPQPMMWSNTAPDPAYGGMTDFDFALDKTKTKDLAITGDITNWGNYGSAYYGYSVDDGGASLTCDNLVTPKFFPSVDIPMMLPDGPDGDYEVFFAVQDKAGNVSGVVSDIITLDRTSPEITVFEMMPDPATPDNDPCETNWTVGFHVEWTGEAKWIRVMVDGGVSTTSWIDGSSIVGQSSYDGTIYIEVADRSGQGTYDFVCDIQDDVHNWGTQATADIFIDRTGVTAGTMQLSDLDGSDTYSVNWTDASTVLVTLTGHSSDITHVRLDEVDGMTGAWQEFDPGVGTIEYTITGTECDYLYVYLQAKDCAGRLSAVVSDRIVVDLTDPTLSVALNNGNAKTKWYTVNVNLTAVETCYGISTPWQMMVSEDETFTDPAAGDVTWVPFNPAPTHQFPPGSPDGTYGVFVKVRDYAGREAMAFDDIYIDRTPASATFTITAPTAKAGGCPGAATGYTCTPYDNVLSFADISEDATHMEIENCNGTVFSPNVTGFFEIDPESFTELVWARLGGTTDGTKCIHIRLKDEALNVSDWIEAEIILDQTVPLWSSVGSPMAGAFPTEGPEKAGYGYDHAIDVSWTAHPEAQNYGLCYQWTVDYPEYVQPFPAYPPTVMSNWPGDLDIPDNHTVFETPGEPGIYFLSIFVRDMAGNWSTDALHCESQDYFGGDWGNGSAENYGPSGDMSMSEWSSLANAFYSEKGVKGEYNDSCDVGPTNTDWIDGYTLHDDEINFDDLVIFTFNYDLYAVGAKGGLQPNVYDKPGVGSELEVASVMPREFKAGDKVSAVINVSDPEAVKCLSFSFNYDQELLEAVSVEPGSMFNENSAFLLNQIDGSQINLDGTILGADAKFLENEVAVIHFEAKADGSFEFNEPLLDVRDGGNNRMDVEFKNVYAASQAIPVAFALTQNYPNPFNPVTNIDLSLPHACKWKVDIFNIAGQLVKSYSGFDDAGRISIKWDGTDALGNGVASGIYFYRADADDGGFTQTRKMVLMK